MNNPSGQFHHAAGQPNSRIKFDRPNTRIGWYAVGLAAVFLVLWTINILVFMSSIVPVPQRQTILPYYSIFMLLCGLAAGITGLVAVLKMRERSIVVWITLLPGLFVLLLVLGELLVPH